MTWLVNLVQELMFSLFTLKFNYNFSLTILKKKQNSIIKAHYLNNYKIIND